jgi:hypothetical protein
MQKIIDGKRFNTATAVRLLPFLLLLAACQTAPRGSVSPEQAQAEYGCLKENQYIVYRPPPLEDAGSGTGMSAAIYTYRSLNSGERLELDKAGYQACLRARGY